VLTLANDVVGMGPRLQMLTGDAEGNRRVETEFGHWALAGRPDVFIRRQELLHRPLGRCKLLN